MCIALAHRMCVCLFGWWKVNAQSLHDNYQKTDTHFWCTWPVRMCFLFLFRYRFFLGRIILPKIYIYNIRSVKKTNIILKGLRINNLTILFLYFRFFSNRKKNNDSESNESKGDSKIDRIERKNGFNLSFALSSCHD